MRPTIALVILALATSVPAVAGELVPVSGFHSVELRGGGNVEVVPGPQERVTLIEGSTRFTHAYVDRRGTLVIDTCNEHCPREYRMRLQIESPRVPDLGVSGGGAIDVAQGFAPQRQLSAAVDGGGEIDSREVEAAAVSAAVNGGGKLLVRAGSTLSSAVNGGGLVRYWGNPAVTTAIQGGGAVQRGY